MSRLFDDIRVAVYNGNYLVSWHADERCEERHIAAWQVVAGLEEGELVEERRYSEPNSSVVVRNCWRTEPSSRPPGFGCGTADERNRSLCISPMPDELL